MQKPFDVWNERKKSLEYSKATVYAHEREIWWCSLGVNVGVETDGKNADFERPVIVVRVYNLDALLILPITSKKSANRFHYHANTKTHGSVWVKLTQARVVSSKRLLRKIDVMSIEDFQRMRVAFGEFL